MDDEIKLVFYYVVVVPHKAGEGARVLTAFKEAELYLAGFLGYPKTARKDEFIFIVEATYNVLVRRAGKKAGLTLGRKHKALLVEGKNRFGVHAELACKLAEAGINVT